MGKSIFKIIGIVLGSVTAFTGAVFGVMAIMGKFSTPDVYPNTLRFEQSEVTVVYDYTNPNKIYSIVLTADPSSEYAEYEVNQKSCYIYFDNNVGSELITFVDASGNPLSATNNRYNINCNENIYFKINSMDSSYYDEANYGKVVLKAVDSRNLVQSSNSLTINVDIAVSEIYLESVYTDSTSSTSTSGMPTQTLTIPIEQTQDFAYSTTPSQALSPIYQQDDKIVELYYVDKNESDYILIDSTSFKDYSFLRYDSVNKVYQFNSDTAGSYTFVVGVFSSYAAREEYLASVSGQSVTNISRLGNMVCRMITFEVQNSDISQVSIGSNQLAFNLYADNNYLTLNDVDGNISSILTGANAVDLKLSMVQSGSTTTLRFNEVDFTLNSTDVWSTNGIGFISLDGTQTLAFGTTGKVTLTGFGDMDGTFDYTMSDGKISISVSYNKTETDEDGKVTTTPVEETLEFSYTLSGIAVDGRYLIGSLTYEGTSFSSSSGAVFVSISGEGTEEDPYTYSLAKLVSGSYVDFFINDSTGSTPLVLATSSQFSYSASYYTGTAGEKTWKIIAKTMPSLGSNQSLVFVVLVVNASGGCYYAYVTVNVSEVSLSYSYVDSSKEFTLDVTYADDFTSEYGELTFSEIVSITSGSYDACVFVTPYNANGYDIEVISGVYFVDSSGNKYVLVGYFNSYGDFVNSVKVKDGATNSGTSIYMLQLKNAYGVSVEEYLTDILTPYLSYNSETQTYYISYTLEEGGEALSEVCLYAADNSATGIAELVKAYTTSDDQIVIYVNYELNTAYVSTSYSSAKTSEDVEYLNVDDLSGSITVVEGETYSMTISSNIGNMLSNIFNTTESTTSVELYYADGTQITTTSGGTSGNITINSTNISGNDIVISFKVGSSLSIGDYLVIVFGYKDDTISSYKIYIKSTTATDIVMKVDADESGSYTDYALSSTSSNLDSSTSYVYIKAVIDYYDGAYTYTYYLMSGAGEVITTISSLSDLFNLSSPISTSNYYIYVDSDVTNYTQTIFYESLDTSILTAQAASTLDCEILGIGDAILMLTSGNITRYIYIQVTASEKFLLSPAGGNTLTISGSNNTLTSLGVTYTYDGASLGVNSTTVDVIDVDIYYFGGNVTLTSSYNNADTWTIVDENETTVVTVVGSASGWTVTKYAYTYVGLTITVTLKVDTLAAVTYYINFYTSTEVNVNSLWTTYYQGTTVELVEVETIASGASSSTATFDYNSIFQIINTQGTSDITITINGEDYSYSEGSGTYTFATAGSYTFAFSLNGSQLISYGIKVVPNIVLGSSSDTLTLTSDTSYNMFNTSNNDNAITLQYYDTTATYGTSASATSIYPADNLKTYTITGASGDALTATSLGVSYSTDLAEAMASYTNSTFTLLTAHITDISKTYEGTLTVTYDGYIIGSVSVKVSNLYSAGTDTTKTYYDSINKVLTLSAYTDYENFLSVLEGNTATSYKLSSISLAVSVDGLAFTVSAEDENHFSISDYPTTNTTITSYLGVVLIFTFSDGTDIITISTANLGITVNIYPYLPSTAVDADGEEYVAYSESDFDLLNNIFSIDDGDEYISKLTITAVDNASVFESTSFLGSGYGVSQNDAISAIFTGIEGDYVDVKLTYQIVYNIGAGVYTYEYTLRVYNYQLLTISYPFSGLTISSSINFNIINDGDSITDGSYMGGSLNSGSTTVYTMSGFEIEPVQIGQTLSLDEDDLYDISRVNISNRSGNGKTEFSYTITLIGYQSRTNAQSYANSGNGVSNTTQNTITYGGIVVDNNNHTITFNTYGSSFGSDSYAYFVFKLTTNSGQIQYFYVYLYNTNSSTNFSSVSYAAEGSYDFQSTTSASGEVYVSDSQLLGVGISNIASALHCTSATSSNLSFYLMGAEMMGSTTDSNFYSLVSYSQFDNITSLSLPYIYNYLTLKIGVLYHGDSKFVFLGTLTYYITPGSVSVTNTNDSIVLNYVSGYNTGVYTANIAASTTEFASPFTVKYNGSDALTPTLKFVSVSGDGYSIATDGSYIYYSSTDNQIVTLSGTKLNFDKYVTTTITFCVEYTYTLETEKTFVLQVYYTYNKNDISIGSSFTVGSFSTANGFSNELDITDIVGDNYKKDFSLTFGSLTYEFDMSDVSTTDPLKSSDDYLTITSGGVKLLYLNQTSYTLQLSDGSASYQVTLTIYFSGSDSYIKIEGGYASGEYRWSDDTNYYFSYNSFIISIDQDGLLSVYRNNGNDLAGQVNLQAVLYSYSAGDAMLIFSQTSGVTGSTNYAYTLKPTLRLTDVDTTTESTITINVLQGTSMTLNSNAEGASSATALASTTAADIDFTSPIGSSITFAYAYSSTLGYYTYSIGGLTIHTNAPLTLSITPSDSSYFVSQAISTETETYNYITYNFTHSMRKDNVVILYITVKDASGVGSFVYNNSSTIQFYVKVAQTYIGVVSVYDTVGATHSNQNAGASISSIYDYLFGVVDDKVDGTTVKDVYDSSAVLNTHRVAIYTLDGTYCYDYDYEKMGFDDTDNPNYVTISSGSYMQKTGDIITFSDSVTSNTPTLITMYMGEKSTDTYAYQSSYIFQVMPGSTSTGLDYQIETNGTTSSGNYYVAMLIDSSASSSTYVDSENIASLYDTSNSVFFITAASLYVDSSASSATLTAKNKVYSADNLSYTYTLTYDYYVLKILVDRNRDVYVSLSNTSGATMTASCLNFSLTFYGDSGLIISQLQLFFYNYSIGNTTSSSAPLTPDSQTIDVSKYITITSNVDSGTASGSAYDLDVDNSQFTINNATYTGSNGDISYNTTSGAYESILFSYKVSSKVLETYSVATSASITLRFKVQIGEYFVGYTYFYITLSRNFEFKINGSTLTTGNTSFYTNYALNGAGTTDFSYTDYLTQQVSEGYSTTIGTTVYYTDLLVQIVSTSGSVIDLSSYLSITETSTWGTDYVSLTNTTITFNKDFSGSLILTLSVNLGRYDSTIKDYTRGSYSVSWDITVLGYLTLEYKSTSGANTILAGSSSAGFESGTSVNTIYSSTYSSGTNTGTGIYMTTNTIPSTSIYAVVDYIVVEYPSSVSINAYALFEANLSKKVSVYSSTTYVVSGNTVSVSLPSVAQSSTPYTYYLVIYRISLNYQWQTTQDYYVSYKVFNESNITANASIAEDLLINADSGLASYDSVSTYLNLLYYKETYTLSGVENKITIVLNANAEKVLAYNGNNYSYDSVNNYYYSTAYTIKIGDSAISIKNSSSGATTDYTYTKEITKVYEDSGVKSIFSVGFESIDEFATFISEILSSSYGVSFTNMTNCAVSTDTLTYKLVYIGNGAFGINLLSSVNKGTLSKLFNNEFTADLNLVSNGEIITTVSAYSSDTVLGFGLTTSNKISATTTYTVKDIFPTSYITVGSGYDRDVVAQYTVVGYYSSTSNMTNNLSASLTGGGTLSVGTSSKIATITVPTSSGSNTYYLYVVSVTGSTSGTIYALTAEFYALVGSTATFTVVQYSSSLDDAIFEISYSSSDAVFSLSEKFYTYSMSSNVLTRTELASFSVSETGTEYTTVTSTAITMENKTLRAYRNSNPESEYLTLTFTETFEESSPKLVFSIRYVLPSSATASVNTDSSTSSGTLTSESYTFSISIGYYTLNGNAAAAGASISSMSITSQDSTYTSEVNTETVGTLKITLNYSTIVSYFSTSSDDLTLTYSGTITDGSTEYAFSIDVVVRYSSGTYSYTYSQTN